MLATLLAHSLTSSSNRILVSIRSMGSTPLNMCMVAQGFADAYCEFDCHAWDIAAAALIVKEAGGVVVDPSMKPLDLMSRRMLCASTPELAQKLSNLLIQNSATKVDWDASSLLAEQRREQEEQMEADWKRNKNNLGMLYEDHGRSFENRHLIGPENWISRHTDRFGSFYRAQAKDEASSDPILPGQGTPQD